MSRAAQGADIVVHAAAMKQVPACEYNPFEAVRTNVLGAQHVVDAAIDAGVKKVVALSTDKAVNPVNLYGATKLCAEKIVVQGNAYAAQSHTRLSCVRYGNVVGSRGSVVPLFRQQAADGRLTITDERMTRFWITLAQAVDLVLYALEQHDGRRGVHPQDPVDAGRRPGRGHGARRCPARSSASAPARSCTRCCSRPTRAGTPIDAGDVYVVLPEHPWWTEQPALGGRQAARRRLRLLERHQRPVARRTDELAAHPAVIPYGRQSIDDDDIAAVVAGAARATG